MINLFNGYVPAFTPLSNITPFTHRDGLTYLDVLEELRKFVNDDMVKFINENFTGLGDAVTEEVNKLITDLTAAIEEQTTIVNDQLTNQNNAVAAQLDEQNDLITAAISAVNAGISTINATLASAVAARDAAAAANTAAQGAKTAAETASGSAITANTAAQSAKTAAEAANTAAQGAKTGAETASGSAVVAKNAAEAASGTAGTAKTAAEAARDAAIAANAATVAIYGNPPITVANTTELLAANAAAVEGDFAWQVDQKYLHRRGSVGWQLWTVSPRPMPTNSLSMFTSQDTKLTWRVDSGIVTIDGTVEVLAIPLNSTGTLTLPWPANRGLGNRKYFASGAITYMDAPSTAFMGSGKYTADSTLMLGGFPNSAGSTTLVPNTATVPFTWAVGDGIGIFIQYLAL